MITVTTTYDYAADAYRVIAYDIPTDVLISATDVELTSLNLLGEPADVFDTESGTDSILAVESGDESDACAECRRLVAERGYAMVGPLGSLTLPKEN